METSNAWGKNCCCFPFLFPKRNVNCGIREKKPERIKRSSFSTPLGRQIRSSGKDTDAFTPVKRCTSVDSPFGGDIPPSPDVHRHSSLPYTELLLSSQLSPLVSPDSPVLLFFRPAVCTTTSIIIAIWR